MLRHAQLNVLILGRGLDLVHLRDLALSDADWDPHPTKIPVILKDDLIPKDTRLGVDPFG
jgi:hypothetical protein